MREVQELMNFENYELFEDQYEKCCEICASGIRTIMARIENLEAEARLNASWNPYHEIRSRTKTFDSVCHKLEKKGLSPTPENLKKLHDIGGIRIVVPFEDDVYAVRDALAQQPSMSIQEERDYIKEPKKSGYRALHLLVVMDVYLSSTMVKVPVEIQIRGILIDSWAVLEHRIRYKPGDDPDEGLDPEIDKILTEAAETLRKLDNRLSKMRDSNDTIETPESTEPEDTVAITLKETTKAATATKK